MRLRTSTFIVYCILLTAGPVYSSDRPGSAQDIISASSGTEDPGNRRGLLTGRNPLTGGKLIYFPPGDLYPPYAADPVRVGFGIQPTYATKVGIANASSSRLNLKAGAHLGIVRTQPHDQPDLGWQLSLVGGFNDQNDIHHSLDNIGWDGHYGLLATTSQGRGLAFKFGLLHVSSHVGDEYMQRTGRQRIGYTRQEIAGGISWFMTDHWRIYSEAGRAFLMSNEQLQEPWRAQFGLEYESALKFWRRSMAWYAALDSQSFQERDWRVDVAVQTGFVVRSASRIWRLGVEWYNGRPPIGEFFQNTERYISMGLWIDI